MRPWSFSVVYKSQGDDFISYNLTTFTTRLCDDIFEKVASLKIVKYHLKYSCSTVSTCSSL